jgi:hypothetical protein
MAFGIKFAQHISAEIDIRLKIGGDMLFSGFFFFVSNKYPINATLTSRL